METLSRWIKGNTMETLLWVFKSKAKLEKAGRELDKKLDNAVGDKKSGKLRRGHIMSMIGKFLRGFWHQNLLALAVWYEQEAKTIRKGL